MTNAEIVAEYIALETAAKATPQGQDVKAICQTVGDKAGLHWREVHSIVLDATFMGAC